MDSNNMDLDEFDFQEDPSYPSVSKPNRYQVASVQKIKLADFIETHLAMSEGKATLEASSGWILSWEGYVKRARKKVEDIKKEQGSSASSSISSFFHRVLQLLARWRKLEAMRRLDSLQSFPFTPSSHCCQQKSPELNAASISIDVLGMFQENVGAQSSQRGVHTNSSNSSNFGNLAGCSGFPTSSILFCFGHGKNWTLSNVIDWTEGMANDASSLTQGQISSRIDPTPQQNPSIKSTSSSPESLASIVKTFSAKLQGDVKMSQENLFSIIDVLNKEASKLADQLSAEVTKLGNSIKTFSRPAETSRLWEIVLGSVKN
ncbi:hypothetical protein QAD02_005143 [Eretmocerus hayati]|uniref:Uncharacterized protein n=1 Tax=Eretmocerus hayati TaxID=131215 RepID=A0ACC2NRW0_9HYME|nr:hypothetical protein QAD02_005143 [Eretmocerus hayati]